MFIYNFFKWLSLTALVTLAALSYASAQGSERTLDFGLAKDSSWTTDEHLKLIVEHALTDHAVVFYNLLDSDNVSRPYGWVKSEYLDQGIPVVLTLILSVPDEVGSDTGVSAEGIATLGSLRQITNGFYDTELARLAAAVAEDGRPIIIRALHEADGDWYTWGMYAEGNTVEDYVAAFAHVVEVFRTANAPVQFELNLNRRDGASPPGVMTDIETWFPGIDPFVDMYSISTYNRCKTNATAYQEWRSFTEEFEPAYTALAAKTQKPINVAEVATTDLCGPKLSWYVNMIGDIEVFFPQVEMVTFYFGKVPVGAASNDVPIEWGFPTDSQRQSFATVIRLWRKHLARD